MLALDHGPPGDHVVACLSAFCGHCERCVTGRTYQCFTDEWARQPGEGSRIVRDGEVLMAGRNLGIQEHDPTAHGEMVAIRRFLAKYGPEKLKGTTLYTSGEPCAMCMGAIMWCGIGRLVFAASVDQLATKIVQIMIPCAEVAKQTPFADIGITGGVLADEALALFKS